MVGSTIGASDRAETVSVRIDGVIMPWWGILLIALGGMIAGFVLFAAYIELRWWLGV